MNFVNAELKESFFQVSSPSKPRGRPKKEVDVRIFRIPILVRKTTLSISVVKKTVMITQHASLKLWQIIFIKGGCSCFVNKLYFCLVGGSYYHIWKCSLKPEKPSFCMLQCSVFHKTRVLLRLSLFFICMCNVFQALPFYYTCIR